MFRIAGLAVLSLALVSGEPASAQRPSRAGEVKKLEEELAKLKDQVKAFEEKLEAVKKAESRKPGPGFGRGPFPGRGPGMGFGAPGKGGPGKRFTPPNFGGRGKQFGPWGFGGPGKGFPGRPMGDRKPGGDSKRESSSASDVGKKLDQLIKDLMELRQELKKK